MALIGLLGVVGVVPGLSVVCTQGCATGITVNFAVNSTGLNVTVRDESSIGAEVATGVVPLFYSATFGWGDGKSTAEGSLGLTLHHAYSVTGNYTLTQSITAQFCAGSGPTLFCQNYTAVGTSVYPVTKGTGSGSGISGGGGVVVTFHLGIAGKQVWANDTSSAYGGATVVGISLNWGDGTQGTAPALGFSVAHTYTSSGSFSVTEVVSWRELPGGSAYSSSSSLPITVSSSSVTTTCGGQCPVPPPSTSYALNAITAAMIFGGFSMAILALAPGNVAIRSGVVVVIFGIGFIVGWLAGGL